MSEKTAVQDIHDLVEIVSLDNVVANEERARRIKWTPDELEDREFPEYTNSFGYAAVGGTMHFRFRAVFSDKEGEYIADYTVVYSVPGEADFPTELTGEFAERVAFMAVYPYLRASIFGSATRLGLPVPVLGIVKQGDFGAGETMSEEEVREAFLDNRSERAT